MKYVVEPKKDCFGFDLKKGRCVVLERTYCRMDYECGFYKERGTECDSCHYKYIISDCDKCKDLRK